MENEIGYRKKILAIRAAAHSDKDMKVSMGAKGSYSARSEEGTLNLLQPLLDRYMIDVVCTGVTSIDAGPTHFKGIFTYDFIDCETGFKETVQYIGGGSDRSDKDTGKAGTYAFKNMLIKRFFMVSGEDADNTSSETHVNDSLANLKTIVGELTKKGYFMNVEINPDQSESVASRIRNELIGKIQSNKDKAPWLMEMENSLRDVISKL